MPDGIMSAAPPCLTDASGRQITYLRLSVTDRCDLRCSYCMAERMTFLPKQDLLSAAEMERVATAFVKRGIRKIRVTGGEPLVRKDVRDLFARLGRLRGHGLEELTLTSNGTQLARHAAHLAACGVKRVNISLDTLKPDRFQQITRRGDLGAVLKGIDAAQAAGLKVKINTVALKHENADELADIIAWAHAGDMDISLIEVMPLGDTGAERIDQYVPLTEIKAQLDARWTLSPEIERVRHGGPSRYWRVSETGGRIGFITPLTDNFCASCNRVRVTCTGRIYMCLGQEDHVDLRAALRESDDPDAALCDAIDVAMRRKPDRHDFSIKRGAAPTLRRHMSVTGG